MSSSALLARRMMPSGPTRCSATAPFSKKSSRSAGPLLSLVLCAPFFRLRAGFGGASATAGSGTTMVSVITPPDGPMGTNAGHDVWFPRGQQIRLVSHARHDLAAIDLRIWGALHRQDAEKAALGPRQCMIDQSVVARDVELEFGDDRAARGDGHGLDAFNRRIDDAAQRVHFVEDFPDHVERGGEIRAADAEEYPHRLAYLGL